eukprot:1155150-Pelagomonas_calceolata.AAC.15
MGALYHKDLITCKDTPRRSPALNSEREGIKERKLRRVWWDRIMLQSGGKEGGMILDELFTYKLMSSSGER